MTTHPKTYLRFHAFLILSTGFAVFSMFFGSGNLVFPLMLGKIVGSEYSLSLIGLLITGIGVPFLGLLGVTLYSGSLENFFGTLGKRAPFFISLLLLSLLGPFGVLPRCITVAHGGMQLLNENLPLSVFSFLFCGVAFAIICRPAKMVDVVGILLTPFLLGSLILIISAALLSPTHPVSATPLSALSSFQKGLTEGYQTMDLLAAFFFSATIIQHMQKRLAQTTSCPITLARFSLFAKSIGASLLAAIYGFMVYLGACYGPLLPENSPEQSLGIIAQMTLGPLAASAICIAIVMACLTTTVALASISAHFVQTHFLPEKSSPYWAPTLILSLSFSFSLLKFNGIAKLLTPILDILYPGLIVLTIVNIGLHYLKNRTKLPPLRNS